MKLATKDDIYRIDNGCREKYGITGLMLMENAGAAAFVKIKENIPGYKRKKFIVFCGSGNNGGDGAVLSRKLFTEGAVITVVYVGEHGKTGPDAGLNFSIIEKMGIPIFKFKGEFALLERKIRESDILVDAIYGIGFRGEPDDLAGRIFDVINGSGKTVISLDIPSGLPAAGNPSLKAVKALFTITFGLPKLSMADLPGRELCGKVLTDKISIPPELLEAPSMRYNLITDDDINKIYKPRNRNTNKGSYGHLLIVGGSDGNPPEGQPVYSGAVMLAGKAALRAGAGLLTVAAPEKVSGIITKGFPEAITLQISQKDAASSIKNLENFISKRKIRSVLAGNGFGTGNFQKAILDFLLSSKELESLIIDADGLNNIAGDSALAKGLKNSSACRILTPHIGEMGRLIQKDNEWVKNNKTSCAGDFAAENRLFLVLKDAVSFIANPSGDVFISDRGSSSLAKGGSGDILAGIIGGLGVSGYNALDSCILGAYLLGRAGEIYEGKWGNESAMAGDILKLIPAVFKELYLRS